MNTDVIQTIAEEVIAETPGGSVRLPVWAYAAFTQEYARRTGESIPAHDHSIGAAIQSRVLDLLDAPGGMIV
jgi:hypothetical protein